MSDKPFFNENDYYLCKSGKYTIDCVVQIRRMGSDGCCHIIIAQLLPSDKRNSNAAIGQTWDAQTVWLAPLTKDFKVDPNISFLFSKKDKRK
jgi:hypothetical protein